MAQATRTTNPLPFQDLEPRRFEDLIRQLAYDFKQWRKLEATGRSGSDGSFDARGYEIVPMDDPSALTDDDDGVAAAQPDRLWLVQCKREKSITPKKLRDYLDDIPVESRSQLYGIIFAAACDFSKAARDTLNDWARTHGISETHIWGRGELEDQLYQPKYDNLLFAYFGISLQIRKRSIRTALRSRLAMKKRAEMIFEKTHHPMILLRDPTDDSYPYTDDPAKRYRGKWRVVGFRRLGPLGLFVGVKNHLAYIDDKSEAWDIIEAVNVGVPDSDDDHWAIEEAPDARDLHARAFHAWEAAPAANRGHYFEDGLIPYEDIFAIDEAGDELAKFPHIYIELGVKRPLYHVLEPMRMYSRQSFWPDPKNRIKFFPDHLPPISPASNVTQSGQD